MWFPGKVALVLLHVGFTFYVIISGVSALCSHTDLGPCFAKKKRPPKIGDLRYENIHYTFYIQFITFPFETSILCVKILLFYVVITFLCPLIDREHYCFSCV